MRVEQVIPRATMAREPQPADGFFHLRFESTDAADHAAQSLVQHEPVDSETAGIQRIAVVRVKERAIIE